MPRDNFSKATKELLAKRVAYRCSNPDCRKSTIGPSADSGMTVNIGVAAHICAASIGGKRYDIRMSKEQRSHANNGIWLCQSCSKLIDSDTKTYTVEKLRLWKAIAEMKAEEDVRCQKELYQIATQASQRAYQNIEYLQSYFQYGKLDRLFSTAPNWLDDSNIQKLLEDIRQTITELNYAEQAPNDIDHLVFYLKCLDRPAFQDTLLWKERGHDVYLSHFHRALNDTITAFNTGVLRDRNGSIITKDVGKLEVNNPEWRKKLGEITRILTNIVHTIESKWANDNENFFDLAFLEKLEADRQKVIDIMNSICADAGLNGLESW